MTNLYRPNNRRNESPLFGIFFIVVLCVAAVFGFDRISGGMVREYTRGASGAARSFTASVSTSITTSGFFSSKSSLARENAELRRALSLETESASLAEHLRAENTMLREMARLAEIENGVTARVLSSLKSAPYGTFLINAGKSQGVHEGALVLTEGGYLLGIVTSAEDSGATVQSLFAPNAKTDLVVGATAFTADGSGGGNAHAEVPRESEVAIGDTVVASAYGRPAGSILHIESASSSARAILSIRIPVNLDALQYVYVTQN